MTTYIDWMRSCWYVTFMSNPAISVPGGIHRERAAGRPADRRPPSRRVERAAAGARVRAGDASRRTPAVGNRVESSAPARAKSGLRSSSAWRSRRSPTHDVKNYITPSGLQRLKDELRFLLTRERPAVTQVVAWAASNGDRSENADYQYSKRRLREIDRRIRFLTKRIDAAEVVDPEAPRSGRAATQVFFGATVRYANAAGTERVVSIVGVDEVDLDRNHISWMSPLARALMKSGPGDRVVLHAPGGTEQLQILEVRYERIPVEPFSEPPGAEAAPKTRPRTGG